MDELLELMDALLELMEELLLVSPSVGALASPPPRFQAFAGKSAPVP